MPVGGVELVDAALRADAERGGERDRGDPAAPGDGRRPARRQVEEGVRRAHPDARRRVAHPALQSEQHEVDVAGEAVARRRGVGLGERGGERRERPPHAARGGDAVPRGAVQHAHAPALQNVGVQRASALARRELLRDTEHGVERRAPAAHHRVPRLPRRGGRRVRVGHPQQDGVRVDAGQRAELAPLLQLRLEGVGLAGGLGRDRHHVPAEPHGRGAPRAPPCALGARSSRRRSSRCRKFLAPKFCRLEALLHSSGDLAYYLAFAAEVLAVTSGSCGGCSCAGESLCAFLSGPPHCLCSVFLQNCSWK